MRIALCSQHLIFAEIFAHVLARRGESVIVMTSGLEAMLDDRLLEYADIAVVDVGAVRDCRQETFDALTARMPSLPVDARCATNVSSSTMCLTRWIGWPPAAWYRDIGPWPAASRRGDHARRAIIP